MATLKETFLRLMGITRYIVFVKISCNFFSLKERLARLACIKRTVEDQNPAPPFYSVPRTDVNQVNLKVFAITACFLKVIFVATFYSKISRFCMVLLQPHCICFILAAQSSYFYQLQSNGEVAPQFSEKAPFSYFHGSWSQAPQHSLECTLYNIHLAASWPR